MAPRKPGDVIPAFTNWKVRDATKELCELHDHRLGICSTKYSPRVDDLASSIEEPIIHPEPVLNKPSAELEGNF
jgi:hypothetical protein